MKKLLLYSSAFVLGTLLILLGAGWILFRGTFGQPPMKNSIEGARLPDDVTTERRQEQAEAAARIGAPGDSSQILFGDLHVHTTFSIDAFAFSLPVFQGEGAHPPADACDFARYCAGLDFWSINDHAEALAPRLWSEIKDSIRQCNAVAGSPENPDVVAFLGWEWTQASPTPEGHFGHKNVILLGTAEDEVPTRPIAATDGGIDSLRAMRFASVADPLRAADYQDFNRYVRESYEIERCPVGRPVRELPTDCYEEAATPGVLFEKLDEWGFPALVIPHGTTWGIHAPPTASLGHQLSTRQHDPQRQRLFEVYSGHGASETYRDLRHVIPDGDGGYSCPEPSDDFEPCCWRAGEILRDRCGALPSEDCEERVARARQNFVDAAVAGGAQAVFRHEVVPGSTPEDWLNCGQIQNEFLPAFTYRPGMSAQSGLALGDFSADGPPARFRYGLIGSSDTHAARPGTGYKEVHRTGMSDARGMDLGFSSSAKARPPRSIPPEEISAINSSMDERSASFFYTGGLAAVHSAGRSREAIFDALERREVYGTSGDRILLWFDLLAAEGRRPMGSEISLGEIPRFEVRAVGAFEQLPGCPEHVREGLTPERLHRLCLDECYSPSDQRKRISQIEVVRIHPQRTPDEPLAQLIEDPWLTLPCPESREGCIAQFEDADFVGSGRETVYYVRAIQAPSLAVNGDTLRCERDADGNCTSMAPCFPTGPDSDPTDDCLAPVQERAWSSPIFVQPVERPTARSTSTSTSTSTDERADPRERDHDSDA